MIIRLQQEDLVRAIGVVQKAVAQQTTMPILKCIYLRAKQERLTLVANNMQIGIETHIPAEVIEPGTCLVDSKMFGDLVRHIKDETIELKLTPAGTLHMTCHQAKMNLKTLATDEFPMLPEVEEAKTIRLREDTCYHMLHQTLFAVADTDYMQTINGQLLEIKDDELIMAGSDGFRFALRHHPYKNLDQLAERIIIPGHSLKEIRKLLNRESDQMIHIAFEKNHAVFMIHGIKIVTRLLQGDYMKYESLIPSKFATEISVSRQGLLEALEITSVFSEKVSGDVVLSIGDHEMEIASNSEVGNISNHLKIRKRGENLKIGFNIRYLIEGLKVLEEDQVHIAFVGGSRAPAVFRSEKKGTYHYLVSPVRVSGIS